MARMIPSIISPDTKSSAERRVFQWFQESLGTENWIVLHSLGLAEHIKLPYGEIDFLVIAPELGMFALEVKGGRVRRENGIWYFTGRKGNTDAKERGPFDQAREGIHSLMKAVGEKADTLHYHVANTFYWSGVMFPDIDYGTVGVDEEPWQVFDCKDGGDVKSYIIRLAKGARKHVTELYKHFDEKKLPTIKDVKYIANLLRGDFDKAVAISAKIKYAEQELVELTQKQYKCVDQIEENSRAIVYGPAGTGKTLLAIRQVEKLIAEGKEVALMCYNASIGRWFQSYFAGKPEDLHPKFVGTFHKLLYDVVAKSEKQICIPSDDHNKTIFYTEMLPMMAEEILLTSPI
ncbi:MAG: NERD domain-containing protein, partial [Lachnospiraceae bacterium]|nr:NERD domain-containing protein [Lachnospiraceae bacterium]